MAAAGAAAGPSAGEAQHVVLCGFGRVGSAVGEALETFGARFVVIERDPDIVRGLRSRGVPCLFGDAAQAPPARARRARAGASLVVVALPEIDRAQLAVRAVRALNPRVPILARAHGRADAEGLRRSGATEVIQPDVEAAAAIIDQALGLLPAPTEHLPEYLERFHQAMGSASVREAATRDPLPTVREVAVPAGELANTSLRDARIRERFGVTVVAVIRDDGVLLNPAPDTTLRAGDRVRLFGSDRQIDALLREAAT